MAKQLEIITTFTLFIAIWASGASFVQVKNGLGFGFAQILPILFLSFSALTFYWIFFNKNGKAFAREVRIQVLEAIFRGTFISLNSCK